MVATDPVPAARVVRLADGSRVVPEEGAQVVVEHVTRTRIAVRVDRGAADVEVVPGLARRFEVRAGPVTVTVLGTAFRVERLDDTRARVSVERGHVDVAWAGGHADLVAGDEGVFPTPEPRVERREPGVIAPGTITAEPMEAEPIEAEPIEAERIEAETTPIEALDPIATAPRDRASRAPSASSVAPADGWRDLARASRYHEAYVALGAPADRARSVTDAVDDLLLAADVARLSGHPAEALPWLEAVERDHASDPRAILASFTRGRILMELGRSAEAARQLERVLAMEPEGSLAEDALARAALSHAAAGQHASAAALAERYLVAHPSGRWSQRMSAIGSGGAAPR